MMKAVMKANRVRRRSANPPIFVTVASRVMRRNKVSCSESNSEVAVPIPPNTDQVARTSKDVTSLSETLQMNYIPKYLDSMFYLGGSIYAHVGSNHTKVAKGLNKFMFGFLCFCALLDGFLGAKFFGLEYSDSNKLEDYVKVLSRIMLAYARIYLILSLLGEQQLTQVYLVLNTFKSRLTHIPRVDYVITRVIVGSTLVAVIGRAILSNLSFKFLTFRHVISIHAFLNVHGTTLWTTENYRNATDKLLEDYWVGNVEYFPSKIAHGLCHMWLNYCSALQDKMLEDILLLTALTNYSLMNCFVRRLPNLALENPTLREFEVYWQFYQQIRKISATIESCFGKVLNLSHFNNLLSFVRVLIKLRDKAYSDLEIIWLTIKIIKACSAYYLSSKAAGKNKDIERWMLDWQLMNPEFDCGTLSRIRVIMTDLEKDHLGVGRGQFYVDGGFLSKFVGSIASFFVFRLQARDSDNQNAGDK